MKEYYVISVKHTLRENDKITLWGADGRGYRQRLNTAGRYPESEILDLLSYYNNGYDTIAVPVDAAEALATEGNPADFIGADPAPGVPRILLNTRAVWQELMLNVIRPPQVVPYPKYPGAPRRKKGVAE